MSIGKSSDTSPLPGCNLVCENDQTKEGLKIRSDSDAASAGLVPYQGQMKNNRRTGDVCGSDYDYSQARCNQRAESLTNVKNIRSN